MTKLYCPKGHETKHIEDLNIIGGWENLKCIDKGDTVFCANCSRRYFAIDCLSEPHVNDINAVETKVNPSDMQWVNPKRESQVAIERVIEALRSVGYSERVDKLSNFYLLEKILKKLEELNK